MIFAWAWAVGTGSVGQAGASGGRGGLKLNHRIEKASASQEKRRAAGWRGALQDAVLLNGKGAISV
jgi:hypothetical protein